jgi:hypothetical protein
MTKKKSVQVTSHHQPARRALLDASVPDALLPEQYFDCAAARGVDTPEKRLMFAVLLDAVVSLRRRNSSVATEAELWIRGEENDDDTPFSFRNVCAALGIEATYLARGLLTWHTSRYSQPFRTPVRQLRTSHQRVTSLGGRRRRVAFAG